MKIFAHSLALLFGLLGFSATSTWAQVLTTTLTAAPSPVSQGSRLVLTAVVKNADNGTALSKSLNTITRTLTGLPTGLVPGTGISIAFSDYDASFASASYNAASGTITFYTTSGTDASRYFYGRTGQAGDFQTATITLFPTAPGSFTPTLSATARDFNGAAVAPSSASASFTVTGPPQAVNDAVTVSFTAANGSANVLANDVPGVNGTIDATTVFLSSSAGTPTTSRSFDAGNGVIFTADASTGAITFVNPNRFFGAKSVGYNFRETTAPTQTSNRGVLTVTFASTAPVAVNDYAATPLNTILNNINILANDTDADGNATIDVTSVALSGSTGGTFTVSNTTGLVRLNPANNFTGIASVNYTVRDAAPSGLTSNPATLFVAVGVAAPVAVNDAASRSYTSTAPVNVLSNDTHPASTSLDPASVTLISATGAPASSGVVFTANSNGTISFTNPGKYVGDVSVSYTVKDNFGQVSNAATLTLTTTNTAPVAVDDNGGSTTNTTALNNIAVSPNDTDVDGFATLNTTSIALTGSQVGGTFTTNGSTISFTPSGVFMGTASVSYTIRDEKGLTSNAAVLSVNVTPTPLPVELISFNVTAAGRTHLLSWVTASEKDNDHFSVERSFDGKAFSAIGKVAGQGSKSTPTTYAFTNNAIDSPVSGTIYYRLQQVDTDGKSTFSPVRVVVAPWSPATAGIRLYPMPAQGSTTLDLTTLPAGEDYRVELLDLSGRPLSHYVLRGGQPHQLALNKLTPGFYLVRVLSTDSRQPAAQFVQRLIKE